MRAPNAKRAKPVMRRQFAMNPSRMTALLLLPCAALLASCQTVERVIRPSLIVPNSLLQCQDYPDVPDADTATDVDIAVFMLRGEDAWRDCRDTLTEVGDLIRSQE